MKFFLIFMLILILGVALIYSLTYFLSDIIWSTDIVGRNDDNDNEIGFH